MHRKVVRFLIVIVAVAAIGWISFRLAHPRKIYLAEDLDKPNILFILIDTLRADHLGCYGYPRNTSPHIDAIAKQGIVFENTYSVAPWTNPSVATLFTGRYPQAVFPPALHDDAIQQVLPRELNTLAEVLQSNGYRTIALIDHPILSSRYQYNQGFDIFVHLYKDAKVHKWTGTDPAFVLKEVERQLLAIGKSKAFLYLHLVYPHRPYIAPPPYDKMYGPGFRYLQRSERRGVINMYDAEIRQTDDVIGNIVEMMRARKILRNTYLVFTSDHGEGLGEHGYFDHGNSFYNELLRIPLIILPPEEHGTSPLRITEPVSNIDLYPTILDLARVSPPPGTEGSSLLRFVKNKDIKQTAYLFSESPHSGDIQGAACFSQNMKYIYEPNVEARPHHFFNLASDPRERVNLVKHGGDFSTMQQRLLAHLSQSEKKRALLERKSLQPDEETKEHLRALGYTAQ